MSSAPSNDEPSGSGGDATAPRGKERPLAFIVSLALGAGAGHLLRGRPRRGAGWLAVVLLSLLLLPALGVRALLLTGALYLAAALDAALVTAPARAPRGWGRMLRSWAAFAAVALLVGFGLQSFVVDTFRVPGPSMEPTLSIGDVFIVNKLARTFQPGDVVVYRASGQGASAKQRHLFVHRVIAAGGATVQLEGNVVYVDKAPLPKRPIPGPCSYLDRQRASNGVVRWQELPCQTYEETAQGRSFRLIHGQAPGQLADMAALKVPTNAYYVLGDNRDTSNDSRAWGPVPARDIVGRVVSLAWSRGRDGLRAERIGRAVR
ncbi:MAG: signal peptidase I [Proteobacteria bacterium]|nr:signal peptidase I [Pseudomonadota bacterium]